MGLQTNITESLCRTKKTIRETRQLGVEIADALDQQNGTVDRVHETVKNVSGDASRANQTLVMFRRRLW